MDNSGTVIVEQLQTLLIMLERPLVQRQLITLAVVLAAAWLTLPLLNRGLGGRQIRQKQIGELSLSVLVMRLALPALSLIFGQAAVLLFSRLDQPLGLVRSALILIWLWLGFTLISLIFTVIFGGRIRPYLRWIIWPTFVGIIALELLDSFLNLTFLSSIPLFQLFNADVTVGRLLLSLLTLYIFIIIAWIARDVLNHVLTERTRAERGLVFTVSTISRYVIISLGIIFALQAIGLNLSTLTVIGGGLSIGIGIGLQRIVANFISGIVLLFEQSLRPGDVIDINGEIGVVERLNIRATVVRTLNNVEVIVPNENFVINQVITYTKSNQNVRLLLPIGVSYNADPREVKRVVVDTAKKHGLVLNEPEPTLLFRGYGDSSLNFDLAVWINQPQRAMFVRSDLYYMVFEALARHDIEIPFPQRDLNLKRGWEKLGEILPVKNE